MIVCPVCNAENSHLAVLCAWCRSFIQAKVETLDLFATMWQVIESPKKAFHRIAIAEHKNYTIVLAGMMGIGIAFFLLWFLKVGNLEFSLPLLLFFGFSAGPVMGILSLIILGLIQTGAARLLGLRTRFKNVVAVLAYAAVPIVITVVFVLPVEILTFGKYFFSDNPSPMAMKPISYVALIALDGAFILWAIVLYVIGVKVLYNIDLRRALAISGSTLLLFGAALLYGGSVVSLGRGEQPVEIHSLNGVDSLRGGEIG